MANLAAGVYVQRTAAASCRDRMMLIHVKQGAAKTLPSPSVSSTTYLTSPSRDASPLQRLEESLAPSDFFLHRPPYSSRPVASRAGGSPLSETKRKTVARSLPPLVSPSFSSSTCEDASRSLSFMSAFLSRRETSIRRLPFYLEPSLHGKRQYHIRRPHSSGVPFIQYVTQLSHVRDPGVYTPDIRGFSFLRRPQGHTNFSAFYTRHFASFPASSSSSFSGGFISKEERSGTNEKDNKDKEKKNTSSHSSGVWSSLFLFSLLGLVGGWHGQRLFQAFLDGYTTNSVVRVKCIDALGGDETEELVRNEFSDWYDIASKQKGFLSSQLYVQPEILPSSSSDPSRNSDSIDTTPLTRRYIILERWASSVDEEAGRDAAARSERGRLNGETRKNSESSVTDSSDIKNPDDVSKNHRSLAKTKEDQRREAEKRRSIQEAIRGNTGQVYGFDSRRVSPLLRVYFFGE